jgi:hypothetical protein
MIDVKNDTLTLNIGDDKMRFQIDRAMKYPSSTESCFRIDVIDECLEGVAEDYLLEQTNRSLRYHLNFLSEIQVEESEAESICEQTQQQKLWTNSHTVRTTLTRAV